ncbi:MAG: TIGR04283 family arsenosugar biosynthesis glycosyltransferase [Chthoniobacterales bacterium]
MKTAAAELRISVIIPSWRDPENLAILLPQLAGLERIAETIVVDATGDERAKETALASGAQFLWSGTPSRGRQLNIGAAASSGEILLFQHCDTTLSAMHLEAAANAFADPEVIGGAFFRKFDSRHPHMRWLERPARFLNKHGGTLYGDQSIFVRREVFRRLGGFPEIALMEDVEFSRRLRAAGKVVVIDPPVESSSRRHLRKGPRRTTILNGLFLALYHCGVSPQTLHRWYYREGKVLL